MKYQIALETDVGIQKKTNQDSCCIREAQTDKGTILMAVLCDGMGGLEKGEVASASLIHVFADWFENELPTLLAQDDPLSEIQYRWGRIIKEQNQNIATYGKALEIQLGSTITVMLFWENHPYLIAHVGDSRVYKITDTKLEVLTDDQTVVARDVRQGKMTWEQAEQDPRRSVLLQCVGASRIVEPAFYSDTLQVNACYMLCSDGFRHVVQNAELFRALCPSNNADELVMHQHITELIDLNKLRQENDNITAMLIKVTEGE